MAPVVGDGRFGLDFDQGEMRALRRRDHGHDGGGHIVGPERTVVAEQPPAVPIGDDPVHVVFGPVRPLLGAPYVPITPTFPLLGPLGLLPLPSRWRIEFLEPVDLSEYGPGASEDRSLVLDISEQVRGSIQEALYDGLLKRGPAFL